MRTDVSPSLFTLNQRLERPGASDFSLGGVEGAGDRKIVEKTGTWQQGRFSRRRATMRCCSLPTSTTGGCRVIRILKGERGLRKVLLDNAANNHLPFGVLQVFASES